MKFNKLFAFVAALAFVGCTNELVDDGITTNDDMTLLGGDNTTELVVNASLGEEESKATITYADGAAGSYTISARFQAADAIGAYLHHEAANLAHLNVKFEAQGEPYEDENGEWKIKFKAMEQSMLLQPGVDLYAYYPYENGNTIIEGTTKATQRGGWDGTREFTFDADQSIENDNVYGALDNNILLVSDAAEIRQGKGNSYEADVKFRYANAFVNIRLFNTFGRDMKVTGVKVQMKDAAGALLPLTGTYSLDFDDYTFTPVEAKNYVEAKFDNADGFVTVKDGNTDDVCVPLVIAPVSGISEIIIDVKTEDGEKDYFFRIYKNFTSPKEVKRGNSQRIKVDLTQDNRFDDDFVHIYDFASLKHYIQNGANPGAKVVVDADIDGAGEEAIEVDFRTNCAEITGNAHKSYDNFANHTIYGNGYTFKNITIKNKYQAAGFISASNGTDISDLTFENWTVENDAAAAEGYNGIVMGYTTGEAILNNVKVIGGSVSGINKVGGLIGFAAGAQSEGTYKQMSELTVLNCEVDGTAINANGTTADFGNAGGLIGFLQSNVATIEDSPVKNVVVKAHYGRADRYNGLYIGAVHAGKLATSGTPDSTINVTIEGTDLVNGQLVQTGEAYKSAYWTDNYQGDKALVGGLRGGKNAVVEMEGYVFNDTKPALKDGYYHIFNEVNFANLSANFEVEGIDNNVVLKNDIDMAGATLTTIKVPQKYMSQFVFDGNNKKLANAVVNGNSLFAHIGNGGVTEFKNLNVAKFTVGDAQHAVLDGYKAAIFVALPLGNLKFSNIELSENCVFGSEKVGLLAGYVQTTCSVEATDIVLGKNNKVSAYQGQAGMLVGYISDGNINVKAVGVNNTVASGANDENGAAKAGRTFGKLIGTLGAGQKSGLVLNYPAKEVDLITLYPTNALAEAYKESMHYNSFEYVVGGWDRNVTEESTAILNGSKPFHANAFNVWNVETLQFLGGKQNHYIAKGADGGNYNKCFNKEIHRNIYVVRDINKGGAQFEFKPMMPGAETFDGQGCTIENIKYVANNANGYLGLYGDSFEEANNNYVGTAGDQDLNLGVTVKNLTLNKVEAKGGKYAGAVIANAARFNTIDNVKVTNSYIEGYDKVGGLIGFVNNRGPVVKITNSWVENTTIANQIDNLYGDSAPEGGNIGGLIGYVYQPTILAGTWAVPTDWTLGTGMYICDVNVKDSGIKGVTIKASTYAASSKFAGLLVGSMNGGENGSAVANLVIENTTIDGYISTSNPWEVKLTSSSVNAIDGASAETISYINNFMYESYGKVLGGWRKAGGNVKINGIIYDRNYKGIYSIKAGSSADNSFANPWYGSFKQAYDANNTAGAAEDFFFNDMYYNGARYYNEPDTRFIGALKKLDKVTITLQNNTIKGQLTANYANLTVQNGAIVQENEGNAVMLKSASHLILKNMTLTSKGDKGDNAAIYTTNAANASEHDHHKLAGNQMFQIDLLNSTVTTNRAIYANRGTYVYAQGSIFNNIGNWAIYSKGGASIVQLDGNTFNGVAGAANASVLMGKKGASYGMSQILLGAGNEVDNNVHNNMASTYKAEGDAEVFVDYIISILAPSDKVAARQY